MAQINASSNPLFNNISFCDKTVDNIVNDKLKKTILENIENNYEITIKDKNYVLLKKEYLGNIKKNHHVITTKSKGNHYYLYLTKFNNVNTCFYIDKKTKEGFVLPRILSVNYHFDDIIYEDTLIEGELIKIETNNWLFLLSDLLVFRGMKYQQNIITKYNQLYDILTNHFTPNLEKDVCQLQIKKIFNCNEMNEIINNFIPNLNYQVCGLTFHPINKKHNNLFYIFPHMINQKKEKIKVKKETIIEDIPQKSKSVGIQFINDTNEFETDNNVSTNNIKKIWKQIEDNIIEEEKKMNINCKIKSTDIPDIFNLYILDMDKKEFNIGIAHIQTLEESKYINELFNKNVDNKDIIIQCEYYHKFKKWKPINTIENINNNITIIDDLQLL